MLARRSLSASLKRQHATYHRERTAQALMRRPQAAPFFASLCTAAAVVAAPPRCLRFDSRALDLFFATDRM